MHRKFGQAHLNTGPGFDRDCLGQRSTSRKSSIFCKLTDSTNSGTMRKLFAGKDEFASPEDPILLLLLAEREEEKNFAPGGQAQKMLRAILTFGTRAKNIGHFTSKFDFPLCGNQNPIAPRAGQSLHFAEQSSISHETPKTSDVKRKELDFRGAKIAKFISRFAALFMGLREASKTSDTRCPGSISYPAPRRFKTQS